MSSIDLSYRDFFTQMKEQGLMPIDMNKYPTKRTKSAVRTFLQEYVGEPAWAFAGLTDEEDRLINLLRKSKVNLNVGYYGRTMKIEIELG